jgi:hypothetical protein
MSYHTYPQTSEHRYEKPKYESRYPYGMFNIFDDDWLYLNRRNRNKQDMQDNQDMDDFEF